MTRAILSAVVLALSTDAVAAQAVLTDDDAEPVITDGAATDGSATIGTSTGDGDTTARVVVTTEAPLDFTTLIPGERITDADIYALDLEEQEWTAGTTFDAVLADWTVAGEVEELVLNRDGQLVGIVAEIDGGFLGIADRNVFLSLEDMRLVPEQLGGDRWAVVTRYSQETLQNLPEVESSWFQD